MAISIAAHIKHYLFETEDKSLPGFVVLNFSGQEGISQITHFDIELLSSEQEIDFNKILNKRASLKIWCWQDADYSRVYHGIIKSFEQIGQNEDYVVFRAELVSKLWWLTLNYQSRIFQEKSVPDIIEEVFKDAGLQSDDYRTSLQGTYERLNKPPREFCVQYRESDFNFISRLMEEEGIFYFFEYNDNKEVLVIADKDSVHKETMPLSEVQYYEPTGLPSVEEELVFPLRYKESVLPTKVMLKDFNYDTPQTNLLASSQLNKNGSFSVYDYPGRFGFLDRGTYLVRIRNEESEARRKIISGGSTCRSFCAGYRFTLTDHPRVDLNREYLLTRVSHHGVQGGPLATDVPTSYENQFECIPANVPYRQPCVTPKPRVQGTQTAIVVGPPGEKLYMDEKGRAKVQFHWDLDGKNDDKSSCWVRVSHGYAGQQHGIQFHPLVGDEVIVDFLEGDPDEPIIVGRVYNGDNRPPLKPQDKIQNIILTPYQHRLLMDDKGAHITLNTGGKETLKMSDGKKDSDFGNNINLSTADGHFLHLAEGSKAQGITISTLKGNLIVLDDKNENITIQTTNGHTAVLDDKNKKIEIQSTDAHKITIDDQGQSITVVDSSDTHKFQIDIGGQKLIISTDSGSIDMLAPAGTVTIKANQVEVEAAMDVNVKGMNISEEASMELTMKGMNISEEASMELKMKGLNVTSEAGVQNTTKGTMVTVQAAAVNTIQGALVKIN